MFYRRRFGPTSKLRQRFQATLPDWHETRDERCLLVWGDIPFWCIVDKGVLAFLEELDGNKTLEEIIAHFQRSGGKVTPKEVFAMIRALPSGVIRNIDQPSNSKQTTAKTSGGPHAEIENITVNLTRRCNLRCGFCYNDPSQQAIEKNAAEEFTADEFISFLHQAKPLLSRRASLVVLGGEPLLCEEKLITVAQAACQLRMAAMVSTNGTRVTEHFAKAARRARLEVQVSLDGPTAKIHDAMRGNGTFEQTLAGIERLVRAKVSTLTSMVCHKGNVDSIPSFFELSKKLGVREARVIPLKRLGQGRLDCWKEVSVTEIIHKTADLFQNHKNLTKLARRDTLSVMAGTCRFAARRLSCGTGNQTLLVDADGAIYPCPNLVQENYRIGHIRDKTDFAEAWRESKVTELVFHETTVDNPNVRCACCPVRYWCLGGCHGETLVAKGQLEGSARNCADLRKAVTEVMWLITDHPNWFVGGQENRLC